MIQALFISFFSAMFLLFFYIQKTGQHRNKKRTTASDGPGEGRRTGFLSQNPCTWKPSSWCSFLAPGLHGWDSNGRDSLAPPRLGPAAPLRPPAASWWRKKLRRSSGGESRRACRFPASAFLSLHSAIATLGRPSPRGRDHSRQRRF